MKWFILRFGGTPSPAFWSSKQNAWTARCGTPYPSKEEALGAATLFDFIKLSGRMEPYRFVTGDGAKEIEVIVLSLDEIVERYGPIDEESEDA